MHFGTSKQKIYFIPKSILSLHLTHTKWKSDIQEEVDPYLKYLWISTRIREEWCHTYSQPGGYLLGNHFERIVHTSMAVNWMDIHRVREQNLDRSRQWPITWAEIEEGILHKYYVFNPREQIKSKIYFIRVWCWFFVLCLVCWRKNQTFQMNLSLVNLI